MSKPPIQMQGLNLAREIAEAQARVLEAQAQAALATAAANQAAESATGFSTVEATTVAPGSPATAQINGAPGARKLTLGIPRGLADDASMNAVRANASSAFAVGTAAAQAAAADARVKAVDIRDTQRIETRNSRALRHFRLALGGRDSAPVDVFQMGDSITAGYTVSRASARWPSIVRDRLRTRYPTTSLGSSGGFGYLSARPLGNSSGNYADNPFTAVGGSQAGTPGFGLDHFARVMSSSGNTITWTWTGTGVDIDYTKYNGGGSFSWAIDGGAATTVSTNNGAATDTGSGTVQVRGLTAGAHSVTLTWVSGTSFINGAFAYNGDEAKGIRSTVMATLGWTTASWWPTDAAKRYWPASVAKRSPDLVVIALGANDFGSTASGDDGPRTPAAYKANLKAIIAAFKANVSGYVPSFVLVPYWTIGTGITPLAPYADYVTAQYEVAAEDPDSAVAVFDFQQRINPGPAGTAGGFLPDSTHPIDPGNQIMGEVFVDWLATA